MKQEIDIDSLVRIETLPKVFYQLDTIKEQILPKIEELKNLECYDEEDKKELKKYRSEVNKLLNTLETKRKAIKTAILEPYCAYETYYTQNVKSLLEDGLNALDEKIKRVEEDMIDEKTLELKDFFNEWVEYYHLENIVNFDKLPIKINLSTSMTNLKNQIKDFLEKVSFDMECISSEEFRSEVLYEYINNGYDYTKAKLKVKERLENMQSVSTWQDNMAEKVKVEQEVIDKVDEIIAPIELEEKQDLTIKFSITKSEIKELNEFLKERNFEYEILE